MADVIQRRSMRLKAPAVIKDRSGNQLINNVQGAAIAALVNETAGTPNGTLGLVGDTTVNQADVVNKNFAELNAKLNATLAALRAHGLIAT